MEPLYPTCRTPLLLGDPKPQVKGVKEGVSAEVLTERFNREVNDYNWLLNMAKRLEAEVTVLREMLVNAARFDNKERVAKLLENFIAPPSTLQGSPTANEATARKVAEWVNPSK